MRGRNLRFFLLSPGALRDPGLIAVIPSGYGMIGVLPTATFYDSIHPSVAHCLQLFFNDMDQSLIAGETDHQHDRGDGERGERLQPSRRRFASRC